MSTRAPERSVLEDFLAQAVVDDYAAVEPSTDARPWFRRHWGAVPGVLLIGVIIAVAVTSTRASDDERQATRAALADRIATVTAVVSDRQAAVDGQAATVEALRAEVLGERAVEVQVASDALAAEAGAIELRGPGVTVTIDDAPDAEAGSLNQVLDRDLQDIVNALWQMGASGIAVNEQRLTGTSAIRGAGEAILVNYQPLTRPYEVAAVGTTTTGDGASGLTELLARLGADYGLVSEVSTGDVALPAGEVRAPRFAVPTTQEDTQ